MRNFGVPFLAAVLATALVGCGSFGGAAGGGKFLSEPVVVGLGGDWELNGLLSVPTSARPEKPVPAVVLVQGSGPSDMNSTVGGNKPFLDIAGYLAANGIASIRYDKRTFVHGARMVAELGGDMTVRQETIEDAILAAEILRADPRIDGSRIYLVGLSLGGMLAPRIHAEGGNFSGLILLAGSPRLLTDILIEQLTSLVDLTLENGPEKNAQLAQLSAMASLFTSIPAMTDAVAKITPAFGAYAYYYKDLITHPFESFVPSVQVPILVMQGSRDYQVLADKDFVILKELFAGHPDATFKLYPNLNHLFMPTGATNIDEHAKEMMGTAGKVDRQVLRDLVSWIRSR